MADYGFEQHTHDAVVHTHERWHVTHNYSPQKAPAKKSG
jgi:hypothetical protein